MDKHTRALLDQFTTFSFSAAGTQRTVYRIGADNQPAVLLLQELPGMTVHTLQLAKRLHDDGYAVYLPLLFGSAGSPYQPLTNLARLCIRREFVLLALNKPSPLTTWLRALCAHMQEICAGRHIGVIGMCMSGGFVLSLMLEPAVAAPVMCQPAKGILLKQWKASPGVSEDDLRAAVARSQQEDIPLLGMRFTNDVLCPPERFDTIERLFGERFIRIDIDSSLFNRTGISPLAHAVLTVDYKDQPGHPTRKAYETLLRFFNQQLTGAMPPIEA